MTDKRPTPGEWSPDPAALTADTLLLDALGSGEAAPADDRVASLLAAWRADLADVTDLPELGFSDANLSVADVSDADAPVTAAGQVVDLDATRAKRRGGRHRGGVRRVLTAAAAVLVVGGGLVVGAGHATPGNPLWPLARVMYPERAAEVTAEQALTQARQAEAQGRHDDARRLLAQAETAIGRLSDPARAQRLRAELATVRGMLPTAGSSSSATPAPATGSPGGAAVVPPGGSPVPQPTGSVPAPQPTGAVPAPTVTSGGAPLLRPPTQIPVPVPLPSAVNVTPPKLPIPLPTVTNGPLLPGGSVQLPALPGLPSLPRLGG